VDPVPGALFLRKFGSGRNQTHDLWICSQEIWPIYLKRQYASDTLQTKLSHADGTIPLLLLNWNLNDWTMNLQPTTTQFKWPNLRDLHLTASYCHGFDQSTNLWSEKDPLLDKHIPKTVNYRTKHIPNSQL
jgi:hypothetical protein